MTGRGGLIHRLSWMLALTIVAMTGSGLVLALRALPGSSPPAARGATSDLVRKYPLGERSLCCSKRAAGTPVTARRGSRQDGGGTVWPLVAVPLLVALAMLGWGSQRFSRQDGYWVRTRPRRRWRVGPRGERLAQTLGFRYSYSRNALVLPVRGGHFGPVLKLQTAIEPRHRSAPDWLGTTRGATATRSSVWPEIRLIRRAPPSSEWPRSTVDVACLPHPYAHPGIWQLTAVDLRTGYTWATLARRRSGRPTAQQIATFVRGVADDLADADQRLGTLVVHDPPPALLERDALPSGVLLLAPEDSTARPQLAAAVHQLLFEHHRRAAQISPTASFPVLQRQLERWVAAHNAESGAALTSAAAHGHGT